MDKIKEKKNKFNTDRISVDCSRGISGKLRQHIPSNKIKKLRHGQMLGKYMMLEILGQGGNGVVYLVKDVVLEKQWAMKQISREGDSMEEALIMKELDHPGIPRITDQIIDKNYYYLIMDYCRGESLVKYCRSHKITEDTVIDWAIQLCDILEYLHRQNPPVIFRDMKPANVICSENGRLKLIDFGIAKLDVKDADAKGTKGFAAPEQYEGKYSVQSDIYNLGATLLWCIGKCKCLSMERILRKAVRGKPEGRYADVQALRQKLLYLQRKRKRGKIRCWSLCVIMCFAVSMSIAWACIQEKLSQFTERQNVDETIEIDIAKKYEEEKRIYIEELQYRKEILEEMLEQIP